MRRALARSRQRTAAARLTIVIAAVAGAVVLAGCDTSENADVDRGRALFQSKCGTCHALAQAGTSANVGPDLDAAFAQARADGMDNDTIEGVVQTQIENPRFIEEGAANYSRVYMPARARHRAGRRGRLRLRRQRRRACRARSRRSSPRRTCSRSSAASATRSRPPAPPRPPARTSTTRSPARTPAYIETQIVDPNSEIAPGYQPDVMPQDFGTTLTPQDLKGLVDYLLQSVGSGGSSGSGGGSGSG